MRWLGVAGAVVLACACGRFGFEAASDAGDGDGDVSDAPLNMTAQACPAMPIAGTTTMVTSVQDLRTALTTAPAGSTILLADGLYQTTTPLEIVGGHTVRSASGDASKVIIDGMGMADPVFWLSSSGAALVSLTVRNAALDAVRVESRSSASISDNLFYDVTFFKHPGPALRIRPFQAILTAGFTDNGTVACSRFITDPGDCTGGTGSSAINADAVRGWTIRNNVFDKTRCTVRGYRTVWLDSGSRDVSIVSNLFLDVNYAIFLGGSTAHRTYTDPVPTACGGVPDIWGGLVCNNVIAGATVVPDASQDFQEGVALWYACDTWVMHNTIVSPSPAETWSTLEYRFTGTYVHFANNASIVPTLAREGALEDSAVASSNYVYSANSEFVDAAGGDLHFAGTPPTGLAISQCLTDAAGKARSASSPAVGAFEP